MPLCSNVPGAKISQAFCGNNSPFLSHFLPHSVPLEADFYGLTFLGSLDLWALGGGSQRGDLAGDQKDMGSVSAPLHTQVC